MAFLMGFIQQGKSKAIFIWNWSVYINMAENKVEFGDLLFIGFLW
jgi:hypothetical protein